MVCEGTHLFCLCTISAISVEVTCDLFAVRRDDVSSAVAGRMGSSLCEEGKACLLIAHEAAAHLAKVPQFNLQKKPR